MSDFKELAKELGKEVLIEMQTAMGDEYKSLSDEQRASIKETAVKVCELRLRLKAAETQDEVANLTNKMQAVESTVLDWKVWAVEGVQEAFWKGVQKVAETFGSFLGAFAAEALKRFVPGL